MSSGFLLAFGASLDRHRDGLRSRLAGRRSCVREQEGALLFHADNEPVIDLPLVRGWLIGSLFSRDGRMPRRALDPSAQLAIESSCGRSLIEAASGRYLAMWRDGAAQWHLLRDPSAMQPALMRSAAGLTLIASDLAWLWDGVPGGRAIDWTMVSHHLRYRQVPAARTCLVGVRELLPGEWMSVAGDDLCFRQRWTPWSHARPSTDAEATPAIVRRLATTIDDVVAGWAGAFDAIGLELSGGLDSSIIAASLHAAGAQWGGINFATEAADGDEREQARLVAHSFDASIAEHVIADHLTSVLAPPSG